MDDSLEWTNARIAYHIVPQTDLQPCFDKYGFEGAYHQFWWSTHRTRWWGRALRMVIFGSDRCRRDRDGRSHVRTRVQSRADVECLAVARSLYGPTRIASDDNAARGCARLIPGLFPGRLRPSSGTSPNTASVRRRRNPEFHAPGGLPVADFPSQCHGHILHPRRFRLPNGVLWDALPDDCR